MSDPINELRPGVPLDEKQRKELADANLRESTDAHKMAAEQMERDRQAGRGEPVVATVADMLKDKLNRGDIRPPEEGTVSRTPQS